MSEFSVRRFARRATLASTLAGCMVLGSTNPTAPDAHPHHQVNAQRNRAEAEEKAKSLNQVIRPAAQRLARRAVKEAAEGDRGWTQPIAATKTEETISKVCPTGRIFISIQGADGTLDAQRVTAVSVQLGPAGIDGQDDLSDIIPTDSGGYHGPCFAEAIGSSTSKISDISTNPGHYLPHAGSHQTAVYLVGQTIHDFRRLDSGDC